MSNSLIAQLVEQMTVNHRVAGSSPAQGAINTYNADVAQLVEQEFCKLQAVGSNPIISSKFNGR